MSRTDRAPVCHETMFRLLSSERRRALLSCLVARDQPWTVSALAEAVAVTEHDRPTAEIPTTEIERRRVLLHHSDLPRLADAGLVVYDPDRGTLETTARFDDTDIHSLLETSVPPHL